MIALFRSYPYAFVLKSGQWVPVSTGTWNSEQTDYQCVIPHELYTIEGFALLKKVQYVYYLSSFPI